MDEYNPIDFAASKRHSFTCSRVVCAPEMDIANLIAACRELLAETERDLAAGFDIDTTDLDAEIARGGTPLTTDPLWQIVCRARAALAAFGQ